jgi:hypothetical protein
LDTRTKIIDAAQAARIAKAGAMIISGHFDPMVASHAEQLTSLKQDGKSLLILITTPPDPILPALARAQLVAGLACVDFVCDASVLNGENLTPHVALETQHSERFAILIRHVHARQRTAS